MRTITIPSIDWAFVEGTCVVVPVKVGWPELQLTEEQKLANAIARANDAEPPYPDLSMIEVRIERPEFPPW